MSLQTDRGSVHRAGSPRENRFLESFNRRVRDELLSGEVFSCLTEAKVIVEDIARTTTAAGPTGHTR